MSMIDVIRKEMMTAMKNKDKERKESLSMLLSALKNAQIDKREDPVSYTHLIKNGDGVNGIVPQKVRPSNVDKKVEVMFRARNVFTDVAIKVRSNGEELASFKREHMAPGEMEKIVIPKAFLDKVENGEITVSVEKVGA